MKPFPVSLRHPAFAAALLAAVLASSSALHAAGTFTWNGATSGSWALATGTTNWDGNAAITSDNQTDLIFNTTAHTLATSGNGSYIGGSRTVRSLSFGSGITSNIGVSFNFYNTYGADLTMSADTGNASITVDAGEVGSIFLGAASGVGTAWGALVLSSNLDVIHNGNGQLQFNRVVSGTGKLTKTGPGELAFTGGTNANTYSGLTTVTAGALTLYKSVGVDSIAGGGLLVNGGTVNLSNASNQINDTANVEISSGTFSMTTFSDTVNNVKLTGGAITGSTGVLTSTTAFDLQSGTSSAKLVSTAGATKSTSGTVVLSAANTISGLVTVNAGTLNLSSGNTLSGGATVNGGTLQLGGYNTLTGSTLTVNSGGTLLASTSGATGQDMDSASSLILNGGTLRLNPSYVSGSSKSYNTVPVTVSAASTMSYENGAGYSITLGFGGTNAFALNADLTVQNNSTTTTATNPFNISRAITGTGAMIVETYNNISSSADNYGLGRIMLSGDNSGWSGDLVISKGTANLSGNAVNAAGTGDIIIGTTADAFGAGLTFYPTGPNGTINYANNITVNTGGFRSIKGDGFTSHSVNFTGAVTLNGYLTLDHSWGATDCRLWLSGNISGNGGLTITRAGGDPGTTASLSGTNTYLGDTTVATGASLAVTGSLTSNISVATGGRLGGNGGSTTKNLNMAAGSTFFFYYPTFATFNVTGSVTLDSTFGVASLVGGSQGEAINWAAVPDGSYTLIGTASTFNHITNFGAANAFDLGGGRKAYFQNGGGLQLVVTTASGNTAPTISDIANPASFPSGGNTGALAFTISDDDLNTVTLSGSSSNTTLVPNGNIVFGGTGANRTVTVTPVSGKSGTATITVTVTDAGSLTAQDTFVVTVTDNYLSWAASQVPPVTGGPNGDDDNDGVKNLVEYALVNGGERGVLSGNTVTFTKRGGVYGSDVTYGIETSTDLVGWSTPGSGVTESSSAISYLFTPGSPVKNFARLKVLQVP